jgi:hypothetical protein
VAASLLGVACHRGELTAPTAPPPATGSPSIDVHLPTSIPRSYASDAPPGDVPLASLVPADASVTGSWFTSTRAGEAIVVAFTGPGADPFRTERGFVVWRSFTDVPRWRAVFGLDHPAEAGVLSLGVRSIADVTGDGSPDALVFEATGGSGGCGTWRVIDVAAGRQVFAKSLCDARIVPSAAPIGLALTRAVFRPGDAHCCPSATRTTVLTHESAGRWTVATSKVTPTG